MSDRSCLQGLAPICQVSTHQVLRKFPLTEQRCLLSDIAGGFQTQSQPFQWDHNVTPECVYCNGIDTRYHRIFECPAFSDIRTRFQTCLQHFLDQGSLVSEIAVLHVNPALEFVRLLQSKHLEAELPDELHEKLTRLILDLAHNGIKSGLYTDGSCQFPQCPVTRFATYALVLDTCITDSSREQSALIFQKTGLFPPTLVPLAAARTTGAQCIQRSELYAITRVVELFPARCTYTDSAWAMRTVSQCKSATNLSQIPAPL